MKVSTNHQGGKMPVRTHLGLFRVLSQISPQRFTSLMQQVKHLSFNSEKKLNGAIELIVGQVVSKLGLCATYAN